MDEKYKLGINFGNGDNWTGGIYYILNLIHALKQFEECIEITVFSKSQENLERVRAVGYTGLKTNDLRFDLSLFQRAVNKIVRSFTGDNVFHQQIKPEQVQYIFPAIYNPLFDRIENQIFWIPDFQEYYYPEFFSPEEIEKRKAFHHKIATSKSILVLSSSSAFDDFKKFYPDHTCAVHVINFAVTHPVISDLEFDDLKEKYALRTPYFYVPNQFWIHKNHKVVIEAVQILKGQGLNPTVYLSGKEHDFRAPHYTDELKQMVASANLEENIVFLGFLDRLDQLKILQNAIAVIQPSLFEGWSTVVEDTKALNNYIIASGLDVHLEQLDANAAFFNPADPLQLASHMKAVLENPPALKPVNYAENVTKFGKDFKRLLESYS